MSQFIVSRFVKEISEGINSSRKVWAEVSVSEVMSHACNKVATDRNRKEKGVRRSGKMTR